LTKKKSKPVQRAVRNLTNALMRPRRTHRNLILGCCHVPFHNVRIFKKVCAAIEDTKPDCVILAGDFLDLLSLSRHVEGSLYHLRHVTLDKEYAAGNKALDSLQAAAGPGCAWKYLYGNHEDRYFREIAKGDNAKYGDALESPTIGLRLIERGFEVKDDWEDDTFKVGAHLDVAHGNWCNEHAAKKHLQEYDASIMFAHTHRTQTFIRGKRAAFNIGGLFDKDSEGMKYVPRVVREKWSNAFGLVDVDNDGLYHAQIIHAFNDTFVMDGRLY
jgi:predicted phosphodiesterase